VHTERRNSKQYRRSIHDDVTRNIRVTGLQADFQRMDVKIIDEMASISNLIDPLSRWLSEDMDPSVLASATVT